MGILEKGIAGGNRIPLLGQSEKVLGHAASAGLWQMAGKEDVVGESNQRMTVQEVYDWLNSIAPFDTAEAFDNAGLLLGDPTAEVRKVLFCVDVTEKIVEEAVRQGAQLIVSHHPLMFGGVHRIDYTVLEGKVLCGMMGAKLSLIAAHTNLDKAESGTGDSLARSLLLEDCQNVDEYARAGALPMPMTADELTKHVAQCLQAEVRRYGNTDAAITRVAVGPGAYGDGVQAVMQAGVQAYVVGEIKHHELLAACTQGLVVLEAGHYATEAPGVAALYKRFQTAAAKESWQVQTLLFSQAPYWGALLSP